MKFSLVLLTALPAVVFAADTPTTYTLMAPLGPLPGSLDLTTYLQGVMKVAIGIAGILAVIMLVYCGIKLMGTPSASGKSEAKECVWNAIFGVLLALGAWILLYTINPLLLLSELKLGDVAVAPGTPATNTTIPPGNYTWSSGSTCGQITGKIVATVPPSYCSGAAPSTGSVCCNSVDSPIRPKKINGVCGLSNGGSFSSPPTTNLCSSGKVSQVTGTGPFNWTCDGQSGGSSQSCSAEKTVSGGSGGGDGGGGDSGGEVYPIPRNL